MRLPRELIVRFDLATAYDEEQWDPDTSPMNAAERGWLALGAALQDDGDSTYMEPRYDRPGPMPPSWPSTLDYIETHCGGWHGVTSLNSEKGVGKTMIATACAIEAAATTWQVVYFLAEDDMHGLEDRLHNYAQFNPGSCGDAKGWLHFFSVPMGVTKESILMDITGAIDGACDRPILVVFDSINTMANLAGGSYLQQLNDFGLWAMLARRKSRGSVSFMIVSETNQRGGIKGANLAFWSDMMLTMKKAGPNKELVALTLSKARRWEGEGEMGNYARHFRAGRFFKPDQVPDQLRLVQGGGGQPVARTEDEDIF